MKVTAKARHIHIAPRKTRLVVSLVRGLSVVDARRQLQVMPKMAARVVLKLMESAVANASHNFKLPTDALRIVSATVDGGPILYRSRPRAQGRSAPIRKRTSHITIILEAPTQKT